MNLTKRQESPLVWPQEAYLRPRRSESNLILSGRGEGDPWYCPGGGVTPGPFQGITPGPM